MVDILATRNKIIEKLTPSGWAVALRAFIDSRDFDEILKSLYDQSIDGKKFTPKLSQVFRALELCPWDKVKIVMLGQDPYYQLGVADGLAFSCSITGTAQKSLEEIFGELERTVFEGRSYDRNPDLSRWAEQGILLINTALTTTIGKPGQHQMLWQAFIVYLLDKLVWEKPGIAYVFFGRTAQDFMDMVPENNYKIKVVHPAAAGYTNTTWNGEGVFTKLDTFCEKTYGKKIEW